VPVTGRLKGIVVCIDVIPALLFCPLPGLSAEQIVT
jgi:hypothetical protein